MFLTETKHNNKNKYGGNIRTNSTECVSQYVWGLSWDNSSSVFQEHMIGERLWQPDGYLIQPKIRGSDSMTVAQVQKECVSVSVAAKDTVVINFRRG